MIGLGTIINTAAVLAGSCLGLVLKGGLPKRFQDIVMGALGLCTMFIGISGALTGLLTVEGNAIETQETMMMIASMITGALIGEFLDIERRLEGFGEWCKKIVASKAGKIGGMETFVEAFVTSSLVICVGAMAIVGALEDGLNHNYSILFAKSVMDGVLCVVFAASLGVGVCFSALPILVYQGGITLLAGLVRPYLTESVIGRMSFVGSVLIFALGINLVFGKKLKIGNMLPAMFMPLILQVIL